MRTEDFDFELPEELIAQHPPEVRDQCRLLVLDKESGAIAHRQFDDILEYLRPGDVLETECVIEKQKPPFYWAKGTGKVDGELSVSASFSFAVFPAEEKKG